MQDTGCLGLVHWDDPEGWYGEGDGRGVQDGEHVYTRGRFMLMCGRINAIFKVKIIKKNKIKRKPIEFLKSVLHFCKSLKRTSLKNLKILKGEIS